MGYTADQWRHAVVNLLKKTSSNEVKWEVSVFKDVEGDFVVDRSLSTKIGKLYYIISKVRNKYYYDIDDFSWQESFVFSIYEIGRTSQFEKIASAPEMESLSGLFRAAENNLAFNRDALGPLLE